MKRGRMEDSERVEWSRMEKNRIKGVEWRRME